VNPVSVSKWRRYWSGPIAVAAVVCLSVLCLPGVVLQDEPDIAKRDIDKWCGANCLYLICRYHGIDVSYEDIKVLLEPNELGVTIGAIKETAEQLGFDVRAVALDVADIGRLSDPMIVRATGVRRISPVGHFVVVAPDHDKGGLWVCDPPRKCRWYETNLPDQTGSHIEAIVLRPSEVTATGNATSSEGDSPDPSSLRVVYFHSPSCHDCHEVEQALPRILSNWGPRVALVKRSVEDIQVFDELLKYEEHYGTEVNAPPAVFVGRRQLVGAKDIVNGLDEAIVHELSVGNVTFLPPVPVQDQAANPCREEVPAGVLVRFESFSIGAVTVAGLIDGINPCAFTTIVFLLSMLAYLGKSKRELAVVGAGFTAAVFVTYLALGLGLFVTIKSFSVSAGLSSALACGVGALAFVLAGWSFWDFVRYRRTGDTSSVTLGLPKPVRQRIHKVIRTRLTSQNLAIASVSVGFLVAIFESLCTGQVYLPTIVFVARSPGLRASAIGYLLLYNLMFILPLIGILAIGWLGVKSEYMGSFLRRHLGAAKLAMAVLFAALGVLVLATL